MIKYIRGTYAMTFESGIVVETASGIGFAVHVPAGSPLYRSREGEEVMVYTLMIVKEDDISLYGFHNKESLELFRMLITVNGVGAKAAMSMMGSMSADTLRRAILFEDVKEISKANASLGRDGRVLVRVSGTEPLLRIMVEGREFDAINDLAVQLGETIKAAIQ